MSNTPVLERMHEPMNRADAKEVQQIIERLDKLSQRPENPGVAYRNLETISALIHTLRGKLEPEASCR
jgi:hypothetical protein